MKVPARGGVNAATNESPGAIIGAIDAPEPLQPATPSEYDGTSIPCQCTPVGALVRLTIVMRTGSPRRSTSNELDTGTESAAGGTSPSWRTKAISSATKSPCRY